MADMEEYNHPLAKITSISEELERTHLARVPQLLQRLEDIREPEDEMLLAEGSRLSKKLTWEDY
ncbi:uncharacterized protein LOC6735458 [Drosophila simulans]|uniref:GD11549 n=2 Tax=melanogaster subgroup TaxID=32351 RepID=B4QFJ0_DROSI|nr:uncharacterized protein LOC6735458 [Drosophila simulans]XP_033153866.1 uncharacterized protein LOC117136873 [Drosophila mauritiana]EDX07982.1 GD11549 [Drosophila simulans]KMY95364.1 uncharacterized protein Dsimw501_GD11549 [Drosophila simulans]